jgi:hypothetical protein
MVKQEGYNWHMGLSLALMYVRDIMILTHTGYIFSIQIAHHGTHVKRAGMIQSFSVKRRPFTL